MSGSTGPMLPAADVVARLNASPVPEAPPEPARKTELVMPPCEVKLDLACGQTPRQGFQGVDLHAPKALKVDLFKFPWPITSESVDELHCSHFVEHLPCEYVRDPGSPHDGKDFFFAFFAECYRILKPGATMTVIVPFGRSSRAFQDPTHRRFIMYETFAYLSEEWMRANKLDHYGAECNFGSTINHTCDGAETLRAPEAAAQRFNTLWNIGGDLHAVLKKLPRLPK